jgi:glutathione S-transferase
MMAGDELVECTLLPLDHLGTWVASPQVRFVLYKKGLQSEYDIAAPTAFGGLKSEEYLAINPQASTPPAAIPQL